MGKTRLALKAAEQIVSSPTLQKRFADGLFFVPLENVSGENGVVAAVISVISRGSGFSLQVDAPLLEQLVQFLQTKAMLLVLDNFEHLVKHAAICSTFLEAAPMLKLLITSRETLGLLEAWFYPLLGLTLPNDWVTTEAQGEYDAHRPVLVSCSSTPLR
jgi:predicted ATPase